MTFIHSPSASLSYLPGRDGSLMTGLAVNSLSLGRVSILASAVADFEAGAFAPRRLSLSGLASLVAKAGRGLFVEVSSLGSVAVWGAGARAAIRLSGLELLETVFAATLVLGLGGLSGLGSASLRALLRGRGGTRSRGSDMPVT